MKFLADMGISPESVSYLNKLGYNAVHLSSLGLHKMKDFEILHKAKNEDFIILTHDLDFGELVAASKANLPSVITFRLRNMRPENVNSYLQKTLSQYKNELENGAVISISDGRVRVRQLPIKG